MATKVIKHVFDDLTGEDGAKTRTIQLEIDLTDDNWQKLLDLVGPYMKVGRKAGGRSMRQRQPRTDATVKSELATTRAWLREQGHRVAEKGRIPAAQMELYNNRDQASTQAPARARKTVLQEGTPTPRAPKKAAAASATAPRMVLPAAAPNKDIREWWRTNWQTHKLPEPRIRGTIPTAVKQAYSSFLESQLTETVNHPNGDMANDRVWS